MDMSPGMLLSSLIIGGVGTVLLMYGKRAERLPPFVGGLAMCVFPMFVHSLLVMWLGAAACCAGTWWLSKQV